MKLTRAGSFRGIGNVTGAWDYSDRAGPEELGHCGFGLCMVLGRGTIDKNILIGDEVFWGEIRNKDLYRKVGKKVVIPEGQEISFKRHVALLESGICGLATITPEGNARTFLDGGL